MSELNNAVNLALRTAAGHERAALAAEAQGNKSYEMKMKSAGASVYEAFSLAVRAAPEYQGRKIDDKAIRRIYQSNKPRPWWDVHLATVKVDGKPAQREWALRTMLWHLDPAAAHSRRTKHALNLANSRIRLEKQRDQGARAPRQNEVTRTELDGIKEASVTAAVGGRELQNFERQAEQSAAVDTVLMALLERVCRAVNGVRPENRDAMVELMKVTAREAEELV